MLSTERTWCIVINVDRNNRKISMIVMQKPMNGSLCYTHCHYESLISTTNTISPRTIRKLLIKAIDHSLEAVINIETLDIPLNLIFLRSSLSDNLSNSELENTVSNELFEIQQIIESIQTDSKSTQIPPNNNLKNIIDKLRHITHNNTVKWNPGIVFSVIIDDKTNIFDKCNEALVVIDDITSAVFNEFIIQIPQFQQNDHVIYKILRYIQLSDEIVIDNNSNNKDDQWKTDYRKHLSLSSELMSDYIQFMWALHWIPFTKRSFNFST